MSISEAIATLSREAWVQRQQSHPPGFEKQPLVYGATRQHKHSVQRRQGRPHDLKAQGGGLAAGGEALRIRRGCEAAYAGV